MFQISQFPNRGVSPRLLLLGHINEIGELRAAAVLYRGNKRASYPFIGLALGALRAQVAS